MKYTTKPHALTKSEAENIIRRKEKLEECLPAQKQVLVVLVSNRQPKTNVYYNSLISNNIVLKKLFEE